MKKIGIEFYRRTDVKQIARELIGKVLISTFNGVRSAGRIVETEAYEGVTDRASHAYGGRHTARTSVMFGPGGVAYVYLCYGIHHLFNVVTHVKGVPHAVLVRALEPLSGIEHMRSRSGKKCRENRLCSGPGNLTRAMGIHTGHNGVSLVSGGIFIADDGFRPEGSSILSTPRIGVDYAGPDAMLPYRFILAGSPGISGKNKKYSEKSK